MEVVADDPYIGICPPNYVCMDFTYHEPGEAPLPTAFCVPQPNIVPIPEASSDNSVQTKQILPPKDTPVAFNILLTGQNSLNVLFYASAITLVSVAKNAAGSTGNILKSCTKCASLFYDGKLPDPSVATLEVQITEPHIHDIAKMSYQ